MNSNDRGDSIVMAITLTDSAAAALDTGDFDIIVVKIIHKHLNTVLGRYSLADSTVTINTPSTDGIINFTIPDNITAAGALGVYKYQVKTEDASAATRFRVWTADSFYLKQALT